MSKFFEYEIRLNGLDVDGRDQCKASALLNHLQNAATLAAEDGGFSRETLVERYGAFWMRRESLAHCFATFTGTGTPCRA